jgi:hypothetical protein
VAGNTSYEINDIKKFYRYPHYQRLNARNLVELKRRLEDDIVRDLLLSHAIEKGYHRHEEYLSRRSVSIQQAYNQYVGELVRSLSLEKKTIYEALNVWENK